MLIRSISILFFLCPLIVHAFCFEEAASVHGVNPNLLRGIARIESNNNPSAMNRNGNGTSDLGIMQINSSWIKPMGLDQQELLKNPCYNIMAGAKILKRCVDRHGYTWEAIGCYNAVSPNLKVKYSWKVFNELNRGHAPDDVTPQTTTVTNFHFAVRDITEEGR